MPKPLYEPKSGSPLSVDPKIYGPLGSETARRTLTNKFVVPIRSGKAWTVSAGQVCRLVLIDGPQVVDLNLWNRDNPREKFWASRSKQLHGAHMHVGDRFWSVLPFLRPMATVTADTVNYGFDADGAGCHDLLGTRCDPYIHKLLTGEELDVCCHSNLVRAVAPYHLGEYDVHDVLNVFQVTGLTKEHNQYFVKPCPGKKGDYFEFFAEIDLLCAISTCPHGDMSVPIWGPNATDPLKVCRPLGVEVYDVNPALLRGWRSPQASDYSGMHGLRTA
ncbi:MAG: urea carboxylase-associated family protein [Burkholderiales bacterium]